jgi:hypothetical protein
MVGLNMAAGFAAAPLSSASADSSGAHASAAGVPGVVTVSESYASTGDPDHPQASWSALSVAGTNVIGTDANGWTGAGAGAGTVVDTLNASLCPQLIGEPDAGVVLCAHLLPGLAIATTGPTSAHGGGDIADVTLAVVQGDQAYGGLIFVAPSGADSYPVCGGASSSATSLLDVTYIAGGPDSIGHQEIGGEHVAHTPTC